MSCVVCQACSPDLILQSSDKIEFAASSVYLNRYSGAFPAPEGPIIVQTDGEIIILPESSDILQLMLRFMHPMDQPDITDLNATRLIELKEAVEKYSIYPAQMATIMAVK